MSPAADTRPTPGLRERKKQKTREAIQREAMRLFARRGYEETTVEQIAAAAEISTGTFFNYFPSKEDVVFYDALDPLIADMVAARPAGEGLSAAVGNVLDVVGELIERDRETVLFRSKLMLGVPELRARMFEEFEKARDFLGGIIEQRTGRKATDFEVRVLLMALIGAMMEAVREWVALDGKPSLRALLREAYDVIDRGGRLDAIASGKC